MFIIWNWDTAAGMNTSCAGNQAQGKSQWGWLVDRWEMSATEKRDISTHRKKTGNESDKGEMWDAHKA